MLRPGRATGNAAGWAPVALLIMALAASAVAGEETTTAPGAAATPSLAVPAEASAAPAFWGGLWVFMDPATGRILPRPTADQQAWRRSQATPNPLLNKSSDGLKAFALESGGRGVSLEGRFRHALVVTMEPDGSFTTQCSDHPEAAAGHDHAALGVVSPEIEVTSEAPVQ